MLHSAAGRRRGSSHRSNSSEAGHGSPFSSRPASRRFLTTGEFVGSLRRSDWQRLYELVGLASSDDLGVGPFQGLRQFNLDLGTGEELVRQGSPRVKALRLAGRYFLTRSGLVGRGRAASPFPDSRGDCGGATLGKG